jgi:hypothetical protein
LSHRRVKPAHLYRQSISQPEQQGKPVIFKPTGTFNSTVYLVDLVLADNIFQPVAQSLMPLGSVIQLKRRSYFLKGLVKQ